jgi:hypothetical protein
MDRGEATQNPLAPSLPFSPPAGIDPVFGGVLVTLRERHVDMIDLVKDLSGEALSWRPVPRASHLSGLVHHIIEVELFTVRAADGDETAWHGRDGSSLEIDADGGALIDLVVSADREMFSILATLPGDRLRERQSGHDRTFGSALVEESEHSAIHVGQMQLTRHLWAAAHSDIPDAYEHWGWQGAR